MREKDETVSKHELVVNLELRACRSFEEFDAILDRMGLKTDLDKMAYLEKAFDIAVVHATDDNKHTDYIAMASTIMNM